MISRRLCQFLVAVVMVVCLIIPLVGQQRKNGRNSQSNKFWVKNALPSLADCRIVIETENLSSRSKICTYTGFLPIGAKVRVTPLSLGIYSRSFRVKPQNDEPFTLHFSARSKKEFESLFLVFFSKQVITKNYTTCNIKWRSDVIRQIGFPDSIVRSGNSEKWTLTPNHPYWSVCGYDVTHFDFKNGRLVNISGLI